MGIVEKKLSEFRLNGEKCCIELNSGNTIHVHIGNMRIDFSPKEFKTFASTVEKGLIELEKEKNEAR